MSRPPGVHEASGSPDEAGMTRCHPQAGAGGAATLANAGLGAHATIPRRTWLAALVATCGAGCASRIPAPATNSLSGRLVLQIGPSGTSPARQWSASFELRGSALAGELDLSSPLGILVAQARWTPGQAELEQGGERRRFENLTDLARQLLGEAVPLEALFDWLRGRPWPETSHERTAQGFVQRGWAVDLSGIGHSTLTARREAAPTITLRARLETPP